MTDAHAEQVREIEAFMLDYFSAPPPRRARLKFVRVSTLEAIAKNAMDPAHAEAAIFQAAEYAGVTLRAQDARTWFYQTAIQSWKDCTVIGLVQKLRWYLDRLEAAQPS